MDTSKLAPVKRLVGKPVKNAVRAAARWLSPEKQKAYRLKQQRHDALLNAFASFNRELTPHSEQVYTPKTIAQAARHYQAFITGSDQVWNPIWYFPPFFLDFVPQDKIKLSYAASIAQSNLPARVQDLYREHLKDFRGISVREANGAALLKGIAPVEPQCVLDPTLLLTAEEWEKVSAPRQIAQPYVFCYFLSDDPHIRKTAAQYARDNGLTLVNIPNAAGIIHLHDKGFGDIAMENPGVEVFLSLIRHAQYVFTDSFHASVFSLLHKRQFVVFPRDQHKAMGSRLTSLTDLFGVQDRFCCCDHAQHDAYIRALPPVDYSSVPSAFSEMKQHSLDYLRTHLSDDREN